ncbi:hypothetical protein H257_15730 [Aphanomyces astaci]|uniref:Uncharacterized protein n=1 Tax=Aphanomyces astaci TaxID=112090 RepID=W4FL81_APHAT|nr:hypothetical protein H257_15730 [Aphanomyces astaci]ETV68282.1 hypothetical protein H257_15730 [Aphanomyces astaci]|eukprot:XP_009842225.1 hypothetical protein H257_15730 [Aphanomyces astaci]
MLSTRNVHKLEEVAVKGHPDAIVATTNGIAGNDTTTIVTANRLAAAVYRIANTTTLLIAAATATIATTWTIADTAAANGIITTIANGPADPSTTTTRLFAAANGIDDTASIPTTWKNVTATIATTRNNANIATGINTATNGHTKATMLDTSERTLGPHYTRGVDATSTLHRHDSSGNGRLASPRQNAVVQPKLSCRKEPLVLGRTIEGGSEFMQATRVELIGTHLLTKVMDRNPSPA